MATILANFHWQQELTAERTVGDEHISGSKIQEEKLRAHLILYPSGHQEFRFVGPVNVHVEVQNGIPAEMTPSQTKAWLQKLLRELL
ncbi:MAG TPA: hypothetical protein VMA37_08815 [Acetobacteraceae bacterium]|nr:hypothetical protein [Acetobacteraceae bacterium]